MRILTAGKICETTAFLGAKGAKRRGEGIKKL
jgi:hypothetical protein